MVYYHFYPLETSEQSYQALLKLKISQTPAAFCTYQSGHYFSLFEYLCAVTLVHAKQRDPRLHNERGICILRVMRRIPEAGCGEITSEKLNQARKYY